MQKSSLPRVGSTLSRHSRLAPPWLQRLHQAGPALPRLITRLTTYPRPFLRTLTLMGGAAIFLRVARDIDPLSGLVVAAVGAPLFTLTFCLILPLLIPLAALAFALLRRSCRLIARLGHWVLPEVADGKTAHEPLCRPLVELLRERKANGTTDRPERPMGLLLDKMAALWAGE